MASMGPVRIEPPSDPPPPPAVDDDAIEAAAKLLAAAKKQKPTTAEWFATAKNYVLYANDAGLYDDLKDFLKL